MLAREIMTPNPVTVTPADSVRKAADIMREYNIGAVPVVEMGKASMLRGIITDRDIAIRCTCEAHSPLCLVAQHMTPLPLQTVRPEEDVHEVIEKMERAQVRRIPVVNAQGELLGIIAQADVANRLGPSEPREVEQLLERVSAPSVPAMHG
jgi:CBS domain-containing protein